ncbi:patatin-like phospholipase family protein [Shimia sp. MMG029]|uniref:patatin-like phospholipase family protein n=1 Tax=Shimia sp. MMG029 TaxID=3021978 RepID=UPI0022FDFE46|nr:patatin-like phospholipase family protein [Shimia sp. MMG029]MDA5557946.1 patatin-like phospholipase family protein [Shimia sp. MMG029]
MTDNRYDIVFQGGGANFVNLLPAIESIHESVDRKQLQVKSIYGSSAGAIAAALLATGASIPETIKQMTNGKGYKLASDLQFEGGTVAALAKIAMGYPLIGEEKLLTFLRELLTTREGTAPGAHANLDFKYDVYAIVSDLETSSASKIQLNGRSLDEVCKIICSSCSIPFVFRNHRTFPILGKVFSKNKDLDYARYVDGGLVQNLPVECATTVKGSNPFHTLAIGFDESENDEEKTTESENDVTSAKYGIKDYFKKLASTSIASNVSSSRGLLPASNILKLNPEYGLLAFQTALDDLKNAPEKYREKKLLSDEFLSKIVDRDKSILANENLRKKNPVPSTFDELREACTNLTKSKHPKSVTKSGYTFVEMNSLREKSDPSYSMYDRYFHEFTYQVPDEGMECILLGVSKYDTAEELKTLQQFEVKDDRDEDVEFDVLPIMDISENTKNEELSYVAILLRQKVMPTQSRELKVLQRELIAGGFPDLDDPQKRQDVLDYSPEHGLEYEELTLAFGLSDEAAKRFQVYPLTAAYDKDSEGLNFIQLKKTDAQADFKKMCAPGTIIHAFKNTEPFEEGDAFVVAIKHSSWSG